MRLRPLVYPCRVELLNWTVQERQGLTIYSYGPEIDPKVPINEAELKEIGRDDLRVGQQVVVPGLFGRFLMTVQLGKYGEFYAETEDTLALLRFEEDDGRTCWVCEAMINKRGLLRMNLHSDGAV